MNPIVELKKIYKEHGKDVYVTSPYGPRTGKYAGFHRGTDVGGIPCGYPIYTPFAGKVVAAKTSSMGTWGNTVCIELDPDGQYVSLNAHLQKITVNVGDHVDRGDQIGTNGGTNHSGSDYDCHIHYEIQINNGSAPWRGDLWGDPEKFELVQEFKPSTKFKPGDIIKNNTRYRINIRLKPTTNSGTKGQVQPGAQVKVVNNSQNGISANGHNWWFIGDGWIAEDYFVVVDNKEYLVIAGRYPTREDAEKVRHHLIGLSYSPSIQEVNDG